MTPSGSIGVDGQSVCGNTALATTATNRRELTAAELLKQVEAERLQKRAISEEESKVWLSRVKCSLCEAPSLFELECTG